MNNNNHDGHADVSIKPPFLFLGALALGCLLTLLLPFGTRLASPNSLALTVGLVFVGLGFALVLLSVRRFRLAGTPVPPDQPVTALVTEGPYRFTRNPIYIGLILIYFGLSIVLTSIWMLVLLIPVLIILQRGVVEREEVYLERTFGDAYRKYKERVPRWL
jgi:protein-S-isoprenylcysteine O-methyltransferase Ste14